MTSGAPSSPALASVRSSSAFQWPRDISSAERKSLIAGGLGWMLDAMDVMLYSLVLTYLIRDFSMSKGTAGLLGSLTLIASAIGGFLFGVLADRIGRTRALMASILVYSLASAACGFSHSISQLAVFRFLLGLGMGGEWTTGAALIAETWRAVFFVGVLPALLVLWIYSGVPEPDLWKNRAKETKSPVLPMLLEKEVFRNGILATTMNAFSMFGYWGLFIWIPSYLSLPVSNGGRGLSLVAGTTFYLVLAPGKWLGYASFGFFADAFGRRKPYFTYLLIAAILVPLYAIIRSPILLLLLGPFVAFFGTGFFSGYAAIVSEIFPGEIRAAAMGLSYNLGRGLSAAAPFAVGAIASRFSFLPAFFLLAGAFFAAAFLALLLPETRGRKLT